MEQKQYRYESDVKNYAWTSHEAKGEASTRPLETQDQVAGPDNGEDRKLSPPEFAVARSSGEAAVPIDSIVNSLAATAYESLELLAAPPPGTLTNDIDNGYNEFRTDQYPTDPPRSIEIPAFNPAGGGPPLEQVPPFSSMIHMAQWNEQSEPLLSDQDRMQTKVIQSIAPPQKSWRMGITFTHLHSLNQTQFMLTQEWCHPFPKILSPHHLCV